MSMNVDAVMIVAHPDDDGLFGGAIQLAFNSLNWGVVCLTNNASNHRGHELISWQRYLGTKVENIRFLDFPDDATDIKRGESSFTVEQVTSAIASLCLKAKLIITHNHVGEYGHPHHKSVHKAVVSLFQDLIVFGDGIENCDLQIKVPCFVEELSRHYSSQKDVIKIFHERSNCCQVGRYVRLSNYQI